MELAPLIGEYDSKVHRIVESQEKVATMTLVDTLEEQALLEALIEETKPATQTKPVRHYLIQTPFRYPPLKHGSRFGSRFKPSLFYAGQTLKAALCESAFYGFYFMSRPLVPFEGTIINHKTSFEVKVKSSKHADLTAIENAAMRQKLEHKTDYSDTQSVGQQMREEGVESFSYCSARCENQVNVGVFEINAIKNQPSALKHWEVKQTPNEMLFFCASTPILSEAFSVASFMVDGRLPHPSI